MQRRQQQHARQEQSEQENRSVRQNDAVREKGARTTHAVPGRLGFSTAHPDGYRSSSPNPAAEQNRPTWEAPVDCATAAGS